MLIETDACLLVTFPHVGFRKVWLLRHLFVWGAFWPDVGVHGTYLVPEGGGGDGAAVPTLVATG